jgi:hypothetical protein
MSNATTSTKNAQRTEEERLAIAKEWLEAKAKKIKLADFLASKTNLSQGSLYNHLAEYKQSIGVEPQTRGKATIATPSSVKGQSLEDEIEAAVASQMKSARIKAWTDKIKELELQLSAARRKLEELQPTVDKDQASFDALDKFTSPANQN